MTDFLLEGESLARLQREVRLFGSQKDLAEKTGIPATTLSQIISKGGDVTVSRLGRISAALGRSIDYFWSGESACSDRRSGDPDMVPIRQIDLTFGMGATYLDLPVTERIHEFPKEWVRTYTKASPEKLFFAQGIGDSMASTILDSDLLLIDSSQNHLNMGDKIWAITYGDVGMVKRLRPIPGGSVTVLSDNPSVSAFDAVDGEMSVVGRVVAVIRKM